MESLNGAAFVYKLIINGGADRSELHSGIDFRYFLHNGRDRRLFISPAWESRVAGNVRRRASARFLLRSESDAIR